jgi:hypothetical protein
MVRLNQAYGTLSSTQCWSRINDRVLLTYPYR